jgi:hypothetical protein
MRLSEILNRSVDYEVVRATGGMFKTHAVINQREITFTAEEEQPGEWLISFKERDQQGVDTYGKTGSGGELQVFSMVKNSISEFVSRYQPDVMSFTSEHDQGDNRSGLYAALLSRFKLPGYVTQRDVGSSHDDFKLVKT